MIAREKAVAIIEEYCRCLTERDRRGWLSLMSDKIIHEDPVGVRTNTGHEMVGKFWDLFDGYNMRVTLTAPTIVCGNEAIAFMRAEAGPAENRHVTAPIVDNFVFDEDGKILRVRAFYEG